MGQFVYFISGKYRPPEECGLGYAFEEGPARGEIAKGPNGQAGVLLSVDGAACRYVEDPTEQVWIDTANPDVFIGYELANKPTPTDLKRSRVPQIADAIKLADNQVWEVPQLRLWMDHFGFVVALPTRPMRSGGQWLEGQVLPEWEHADEVANRILAKMLELADQGSDPDAGVGWSFADAMDMVSDVLAINYRVSADELGLLGTLGKDDRLATVIRLASDYERAEVAALKKIKACGA